MRKPTFNMQAVFAIVVMGLGHLLAVLLHAGLFVNIAWVLCGALFVINPVYPNLGHGVKPEMGALGARLGGIVIIIIGLMLRDGL